MEFDPFHSDVNCGLHIELNIVMIRAIILNDGNDMNTEGAFSNHNIVN